MRGFSATPMPATISITPTASIRVWPLPPTRLLMLCGRYLSQSASKWKNLSRPKRIGATVNPKCRIWYACREGVASAPATAVMFRPAACTLVVLLMSRPSPGGHPSPRGRPRLPPPGTALRRFLKLTIVNLRRRRGAAQAFLLVPFCFRVNCMEAKDFGNQLSRLSALDEPVRRKLYLYVVGRPEDVSRDEAAKGTGVSRALAAFHLDKL